MDIADLEAEFAALELPRFDEATALHLGQILVDLALPDRLPVVIDIRTADRVLFHAGLPGSAPLNDLWARRKSNTALMFQVPSLLVAARNRAKSEALDKHGLSGADYADSGGAVPIRVKGVGVVAVATVSGLPQVEDHKLVVRAIKTLLAG
ncbi:heme-degrading domain-containing protein [Tabrizicola sp.]|uniref:heme-degrading domain-containing protein n=1 Tax=Tabrizicola sp. TaxID=2005166 RepID=UPI0027371685|nr:heme-degrading domain-containing protein [Tabrizicola sp.]MDP3195738.1 heme-degrading domain-containing protein [Tabrizicola sp.]